MGPSPDHIGWWVEDIRAWGRAIMALKGYGLLIGKIVGSRPQRRGTPHWLLFVQPKDATHPAYRVAVNLQETVPGEPPELQYQIVDFNDHPTRAGKALVEKLAKIG